MTAPKELRVSKDRKLLTVTFPGHQPFELPAEFLRVASPSAEVQGHSPEQRVTVPGKRNVAILKIDPVGNYAVRITFDDFMTPASSPGTTCTRSAMKRTSAGMPISPS